MTQLQFARMGIVTEAMKIVAADEGIEVERIRAAVVSGEAVIPLNVHHTNARPVGVGRLFRTKSNANLGRSVTHSGKGDELEKLAVALKARADFVMDLSVGSDDRKSIRQGMLKASNRPLRNLVNPVRGCNQVEISFRREFSFYGGTLGTISFSILTCGI